MENVSQRDAHLSDNIDRNRHPQISPCKIRFFLLVNSSYSCCFLDDRNRVCLSRILGHPYINASFIEVRFFLTRSIHCFHSFLQGYSRKCSFIITQDPLSETVHEFWRMFIEHDSNCIVQLHTITEVSHFHYFDEQKKSLTSSSCSHHQNVQSIIRMIWNRQ